MTSRFSDLLQVWARGFVIVCLVSLNTRLIADHRPSASVVVAMLISGVWWLNARASSRPRDDGFLLPVAYGTAVVVASVAVGRWPGRAVRLLAVFPTMHLAWASGFLVGQPTGVGGGRVRPASRRPRRR